MKGEDSVSSSTVRRDAGSVVEKTVSVELVKAFVQRDGSSGNGAGIVLLPGIRCPKTQTGNLLDCGELRVDETLFPSDDECLRIAKRVGLPETSFVLFPTASTEHFKSKDKLNDGVVGVDSAHRLFKERIHANEDNNGDEGADFQVKWYTPEQEIDMCGHATVALAGYLYSIMTTNSSGRRMQRRNCFWRMKCNAGLLGIEVSEGSPCAVTPGDSNRNPTDGKRRSNPSRDDGVPLARVVMEQASPEFCGNVGSKEVADSLCIDEDADLAVGSNGSNRSDPSDFPFPFRECEIVSTGGRDLMIPVRSTVLNKMDILGENDGGGDCDCDTTIGIVQRHLLCGNINDVSKRYDLVGYHMFEVDDALFEHKAGSKTNCEATVEMTPAGNRVGDDELVPVSRSDDSTFSVHLNELIRSFQLGEKEGGSGAERCLNAVLLRHFNGEDDCENRDNSNENSYSFNDYENTTCVPTKSRTILVTGIRNFAPHVGIPEEPATGSANGALACYLVKNLFLGARRRNEYTKHVCFCFSMEQGKAMGEPCLIDAEIEVIDDAIASVKVGGLARVGGESLELNLACL